MIDNLCDVDKALQKECLSENKSKIASLTGEINSNKIRLEKLVHNKSELYTDYKNNILTLEDYIYMKEKYSNEIDTLHENHQILNIQLRRIQNNGDTNNEHIEMFKSYKGIKKLDRRLIVKLIDKIIVDEDKNMEIVFKFQNPLKKYLSYLDK